MLIYLFICPARNYIRLRLDEYTHRKLIQYIFTMSVFFSLNSHEDLTRILHNFTRLLLSIKTQDVESKIQDLKQKETL